MSQTSPAPSTPKQALALASVEVLGRLASLFEERRRQLAEGAGLTVGQWQVLEEIQQAHFMPSMFAQKRASSAAAVSKVLRQLSDKGLITASLSEKDGRQRDYTVTELGQRTLDHVRQQRHLAIEEVWLSLTNNQLEQFLTIGGTLADRLESWAARHAQVEMKE